MAKSLAHTKYMCKYHIVFIPKYRRKVIYYMKRGERRVTQAGQVGRKEVTYRITYDESGKEISREKISEKIVVNPVNEKVLVGSSDYNINTDTYRYSVGYACQNPTSAMCTNEDSELYSTTLTVNDDHYVVCVAKSCSNDGSPYLEV